MDTSTNGWAYSSLMTCLRSAPHIEQRRWGAKTLIPVTLQLWQRLNFIHAVDITDTTGTGTFRNVLASAEQYLARLTVRFPNASKIARIDAKC